MAAVIVDGATYDDVYVHALQSIVILGLLGFRAICCDYFARSEIFPNCWRYSFVKPSIWMSYIVASSVEVVCQKIAIDAFQCAVNLGY
jgi:hypothetical protein